MVEAGQINKIFLTGYMGSGKSFIGKALSEFLDWDFIDLDDMISSSESKSIAKIFVEEGEVYFRKLEYHGISEILEMANSKVIALGGGSFVQENCNSLIRGDENAIVVYLKYSVDILVERLESEKDKRPLIAEAEDLKAHITQHLEGRAGYYETADLIIEDESDANTISKLIHSFILYKNQSLSTI